MAKKILITGASGLLGGNLAFAYRHKYEVLGICHEHKVEMDRVEYVDIDLLDALALKKVVDEFRPDVVIHCAALSNVEKCEEDKTLACRLNVDLTKNVVKSLENTKSHLLHISTDAVYGGIEGNFDENKVAPLNYYGETKLLAERAALDYKDSVILRTNLFGWNVQKKLSLSEWIIDSLKNGKVINGFVDAVFSSIYTFLMAGILEEVFNRKLKGVYNLGSSDSMSKYDFALRIAETFQFDKNLIKKISVDNFTFIAKRGKDMSMNVKKIERDLGVDLPTIDDSISGFYNDYKNNIQTKLRMCLR